MRVLFAVLAILVCAAVVSADVVKLTSATFEEVAFDANKNVFVKFFAPWCGHCVRMAPAWEQLAKQVGDAAVIAEVDVTQNEDIAEKVGIEGFPTLKLFKKGDRKGIEYNGARDTTALKDFVMKNI